MSENIPSAFAGFDVIEGFDPIDKSALVGKPFGITGIRFRKNDRGIMFAELETVDESGSQAAFQDASTGVRDQAIKYLQEQGVSDWENGGAWHNVKLFVPRGLRVSEFDYTNPDTGKTQPAKTYYLTTAGRQR